MPAVDRSLRAVALVSRTTLLLLLAACGGGDEGDAQGSDAAPDAGSSQTDSGTDAEIDTGADADTGTDASACGCARGVSCDQTQQPPLCVLPESCAAAETKCADDTVLGTCSGGRFVLAACPARCVASPLGDVCAPAGAVKRFHGKLEYQVRTPNAGLTDWADPPSNVAAAGVWLLSYRADSLIDAVATSSAEGSAGSFVIDVPASPTADDALVVMTIGEGPTGELAYALADPGFPASTTERASTEAPPDARLWSWRFRADTLVEQTPLLITEAAGSAAVFAFDGLRKVFEEGQTFYAPATPQKLIGWLGLGTSWDCLTCYSRRPVSAFDTEFQHQLRFDGSSDQGYWAESVTFHELGHYLMGAFGLSPREQNVRYFGEPTNPGLAWKEGWATFFSSMERNSTIYYDKQFGGFFWFDIETRQYAFDDLAWPRPSASAGLTQLIDENEVSAMLWQAHRTIDNRAAMLSALASPRMRVPPFERGYTRRSWADPDHPEVFVDTGESTTHLADFFDALRCANALSSGQLDAITEPSLYYPYPSASPLCR